MKKEGGEGAVQELTCPLKFSSVFAREQQPKKEGQSRCCSHVVQHLWRPTGKGMLRKEIRCRSKGGGGGAEEGTEDDKEQELFWLKT